MACDRKNHLGLGVKKAMPRQRAIRISPIKDGGKKRKIGELICAVHPECLTSHAGNSGAD
jgi:hypothetical protein